MPQPYLATSDAAEVVFGVSVVVFAVGELQQTLLVRRSDAHASIRDELIFRLWFFAGIIALPTGARFIPGAEAPGPLIFAVGAVVCWLGLLLRWWSFAVLGRYFTTVVKTSPDQPIIDRGPYRFVRHPGYTGLILAFLGCGLMLGNWAATAVSVAVVTSALVVRLLQEERALIAARGSAYLEYAERRARLIPFVW